MKNIIIEREQYYLDKLKPTLNINSIAGSMLGHKYTQEIRKIISLERRG